MPRALSLYPRVSWAPVNLNRKKEQHRVSLLFHGARSESCHIVRITIVRINTQWESTHSKNHDTVRVTSQSQHSENYHGDNLHSEMPHSERHHTVGIVLLPSPKQKKLRFVKISACLLTCSLYNSQDFGQLTRPVARSGTEYRYSAVRLSFKPRQYPSSFLLELGWDWGGGSCKAK